MKIRCSSLSDIMKKPRSGSGLSDSAKDTLREMVLLNKYGFKSFLGNKQTQKGIECEDEAIALLAGLHFKKYVKHVGRVENDWITGECDVLSAEAVHDLKCPWSLNSFPFFGSTGEHDDKVKKQGYDWQMRGYMMLYERPIAHVHFILLPTPEHLLSFGDDEYMHRDCVECVPLKHRIRTVTIERDLVLEDQIKERVELAQRFADELLKDLV